MTPGHKRSTVRIRVVFYDNVMYLDFIALFLSQASVTKLKTEGNSSF